MWNQTYAPLHWPKKRTTVLEVTSTKQMYWKAATLDTFLIDHWQFSQQGQLVGLVNGRHADRVRRSSLPAAQSRSAITSSTSR